MLRTTGTLLVKKISQSRNGPFCVADLITDFGEFKVKDPLLDQFAEGEYRGTIWISEIYLYQYVSFGRGVTELRARLHDVQIHTEADLPPDSADPVEPDPAEELPASAPKRSSRPPSPPAKADAGRDERSKEQEGTSRQSNKAEQGSGPTEEDRDLFGDEIFELIAERKPVKLDPTIGDRKRFRTQTSRMHELQYQFTAKSQTWFPN